MKLFIVKDKFFFTGLSTPSREKKLEEIRCLFLHIFKEWGVQVEYTCPSIEGLIVWINIDPDKDIEDDIADIIFEIKEVL